METRTLERDKARFAEWRNTDGSGFRKSCGESLRHISGE